MRFRYFKRLYYDLLLHSNQKSLMDIFMNNTVTKKLCSNSFLLKKKNPFNDLNCYVYMNIYKPLS